VTQGALTVMGRIFLGIGRKERKNFDKLA